MKLLVSILLCLVALVTSGCDDHGGSSSEPIFSIDGMTLYEPGADHDTYLGAGDKDVKENEKHLLNVNFSYYFFMDDREVTCGEYKKLAKGEKWGKFVSCPNPDIPVTNVTYYDAVLFANAKSKTLGLDTVYSYSGLTFDSEGNCINMEGLVYDLGKFGLRLPTEAEWVYVAVKHWDPKVSWNRENSDYEAHEGCTAPGETSTVCDFAGNVAEWTNDWLGFLADTSIYNFVGALNGGVLGERVIKGGSFKSSPKNITLHSRGDVYTVTSSTKADYVGFRLVAGFIDYPFWLSSDGTFSRNRIGSVIDFNTIYKLSRTYKGKMAFRDELTGNLAFIDYVLGNGAAYEIEDSVKIYHPDISPNGKYVAFCTGLEGVRGKSEVYVRELIYPPRRLIKLDVDNAAIPRWRVLDNGDTAIVYVSDAGNNKDSDDFKKKSTWQVVFKREKFGEPQKLFDGAYHGGVSDDNKFAVTGARLLRARVNGKDTVWYNGRQACNASLSHDGCKRTVFLDFGADKDSSLTGDSYGTHERLLVVDSTGKLIVSVKAPENFAFDHTEWVMDNNSQGCSNLIIATVTNVNNAHPKVVMVNLADSSIIDVAESDELWHPSFWIEPQLQYSGESSLDPDSAGLYMTPGDALAAVDMRYKMQLLWKFRDTIDVAVVGSSRPFYTISHNIMRFDYFLVNFAQTPNSIHMSRDFLNNYLFPHLKKLKFVIVSLDIDFWSKLDGKKGDNFFVINAPRYPGYVYDKNHNYWKDSVPEGLLEYTVYGPGIETGDEYEADFGRYFRASCKSWGDGVDILGDTTYFDDHQDVLDSSFNSLVSIIKEAKKRDVQVIGVIFPQSPEYRKTGAFGRYGMRRSTASSLIKKINNLSEKYPNFILMDENKMGKHDYDSTMATDNDHLCYKGGKQISERLDSLMKSLEKR